VAVACEGLEPAPVATLPRRAEVPRTPLPKVAQLLPGQCLGSSNKLLKVDLLSSGERDATTYAEPAAGPCRL
jgi:hypothetical protein